MLTTLTYTEGTNAVLRITVPPSDARTPAHFLALIDVSESMDEANKLTHVKHCMSLLLKFLTPADELSVVAFGDNSRVIVKRAKPDAAAAPMLEAAINSLHTSGCTNLSAGLGSIREILEEARDSTLKPGLLVLTDGHANQGVSTAPELRSIVSRIHELFPAVSMSFIAYGTNHNAELLKMFVEDTTGSYSIVETLEGAALSMGDALGGVISCAAQNVTLELPVGATVEGPYSIVDSKIVLGDLYAGSETMLLLSLPEGECRLRGMTVPLLDPFNTAVVVGPPSSARNVEVDLTRLRYRCTKLFKAIRGAPLGSLAGEIDSFRQALQDPFLSNHPITAMLKSELASIEAAMEEIRNNGVSSRIYSQLVQHEVYMATSRGTTRPIRNVRFENTSDPGAPRPEEDAMSPGVAPQQRRVAMAMRQMTTPAAEEPSTPLALGSFAGYPLV